MKISNSKAKDILNDLASAPDGRKGAAVIYALTLLQAEIDKCLPEKQNRKPDEEYMYCVTCNQNIDTLEADCFCSIHNLALDEVRARLTAFIGKEK